MSAAECWKALEGFGGLDVAHYDGPLADELREALGLPADRSLASGLKTKNPSTERFVGAFLKAIAPYGMMMRELLTFFEKASAQRSSSGNLRIQFDFARAAEQFAFDLSHFRVWEGRFRYVESIATQRVWTPESLIHLADILTAKRTLATPPPTDTHSAWDAWLEAYVVAQRWPAEVPSKPAMESLDPDLVARVWGIWTTVTEASAAVSPQREALKQLRWVPNDTRVALGLTRWNLRQLDESEWAGTVAKAFKHLALGKDLPAEAIAEIAGLMDSQPLMARPVIEQVKVLEELLSLPAWKHRHDLYAAWVGARIIRCLDEISTIHSVDGVLRYAFSGSHLATFEGHSGIRAFLWSELRTRLAKPKGKSRKRGIQPDFSVQREPLTAPERCILVVECKQYLKAARKSFGDALHDYLKGRSNASVVLVNYGPVPANWTQDLQPSDVPRAHMIGEFRPDRPLPLTHFCTIVRQAASSLLESNNQPLPSSIRATPVTDRASIGGSATTGSTSVPVRGRITLTWGAAPTDLDLHVWTRHFGDSWEHVFYRAPGRLDAPPWAKLRSDVRSGHGEEVVELAQVVEVRCAVHNYSKDARLAGSDCRVTIELPDVHLQVSCPKEGYGDWWIVARANPQTQEWVFPGLLDASEPE